MADIGSKKGPKGLQYNISNDPGMISNDSKQADSCSKVPLWSFLMEVMEVGCNTFVYNISATFGLAGSL